MTQHTPTKVIINPKAVNVVMTPDGHSICDCGCSSKFQDQWEENAKFIAKAWNSHDGIVRVLKQAKECIILAIENAKEKGDDSFLGYALTLDRINFELAKLEGK